MEAESMDSDADQIHLQSIDVNTVFQYNYPDGYLETPENTFEEEVRKSAIDTEEWERQKRAMDENQRNSLHPFLDNNHPMNIPSGMNRLEIVKGVIASTKNEMSLLRDMLEMLIFTTRNNPEYCQVSCKVNFEVQPKSERTLRTQRANLESSFLLFKSASDTLRSRIDQVKESIQAQRNYYKDLQLLSKQFNIVTYHGDRLTPIGNNDILLLNCSYDKSSRVDNCLRLFPGKSGHLLIKAHNASYYYYLKVSSIITDESRSYVSSMCYHPTIPFSTESYFLKLSRFLSSHSSSEYTEHNLNTIIRMRHSILCRDLFHELMKGILSQENTKRSSIPEQVTLSTDDNEITIQVSSVYQIKIALKCDNEALNDDTQFMELIQSENHPAANDSMNSLSSGHSSSSSISHVLLAFNQSVILSLLQQQIQNYGFNPHHQHNSHGAEESDTMEMRYMLASCYFSQSLHRHGPSAQFASSMHCNQTGQDEASVSFPSIHSLRNCCYRCLFLYRRLFLKYFCYVLSLQYKHLVYNNNELSNSVVSMKCKSVMNRMELHFVFAPLSKENIVILDADDAIYVNGRRFASLVDAFTGILDMFMGQTRLIYMNYCLKEKQIISRDLGNDFAVMNGNETITVVSFVYNTPDPIAFYHAFVIFCKQGKTINNESCWLSIVRKDRVQKRIEML